MCFLDCFRRRGSPTSPSLHPRLRRWWTTSLLPTRSTTILGPHPDRAALADRVRFFRMQGRAALVGMGAEAEWAAAWASWEAQGGQAVASPEGGHHLDRRLTLDLTTS